MPRVETRAARVWAYRERVEREAAAHFLAHAESLADEGCPRSLVDLAKQASDDELDHAIRCSGIVKRLSSDVDLHAAGPLKVSALGPTSLNARERAIYTSVAIGCITETLATALLIELRGRVQDPLVQETVNKILRDEVQHSRLGWGHLAFAAERSDVRWLGLHIYPMLGDATREHSTEDTAETLEGFGVLNAKDAAQCVAETVQKVILPGLARFGVVPGPKDMQRVGAAPCS